MSQPKRFRCLTTEEQREFKNKVIMPGLVMCEDGNLVAHSDYAALAAENERLRKAGDFALETIDRYITVEEYEWIADIEAAWVAAKEGRDAK